MARILIPRPSIPVIDSRTGLMAQAWYAFFAQFLQSVSDDVDGTSVDLTALTTRVTTAEGDIDGLQADTQALNVDLATVPQHQAGLAALDRRVRDLEALTGMPVDRGAQVAALARRVSDLETHLAMPVTDHTADLAALRARVRDLETDLGIA